MKTTNDNHHALPLLPPRPLSFLPLPLPPHFQPPSLSHPLVETPRKRRRKDGQHKKPRKKVRAAARESRHNSCSDAENMFAYDDRPKIPNSNPKMAKTKNQKLQITARRSSLSPRMCANNNTRTTTYYCCCYCCLSHNLSLSLHRILLRFRCAFVGC